MSNTFTEAADIMACEMELGEHVHPVIAAAMSDLYAMRFTSSSAERGPAGGSRQRYDRLYGGVAVEWGWNIGLGLREHDAQQTLAHLDLLGSSMTRAS